jgi:capsular exopolysaccharide synthesis family protein
MVDAPERPERPVTPNRPRIIAVAIFLGISLGLLAAFIRRSLQTALVEPAQIEKLFGLPVYASIPHSKEQHQFSAKNSNIKQIPVLARIANNDPAIESLRNFRSALKFCLTQCRNNIVLITGPTEGLGKSFVSVNLACLMAASGKRILLIDGDLRDGHLHRYFGRARTRGLSDVLSGDNFNSCLATNVIDNLDFLSTGLLPANPSELLLRAELALCLSLVAPRYDVIVIDAAPLSKAAKQGHRIAQFSLASFHAKNSEKNNDLISSGYQLLKSGLHPDSKSIILYGLPGIDSDISGLVKLFPEILVKFPEFKQVNSIVFNYSYISAEKFSAIAELVRSNTALVNLCFMGNKLKNDDALLLAKALENNTALIELTFLGQIDENIENQLLKSLGQNRSIAKLRQYMLDHPIKRSDVLPLEVLNIIIDKMIVSYLKRGHSFDYTKIAIEEYLVSVAINSVSIDLKN